MACVDYVAIDGIPDEAPVPVVLALLVAGDDSVFVSLGRSGPGTASGPEPGASLTLVTPAGRVPLREVDPLALACGAPDGFSCYVAVPPEPLAPGDSVRAEGTFAGGGEVDAATLLPQVPPILLDGHTPGDTVRYVDRSGQEPLLEVAPGPGWVTLRDTVFSVTWWKGGEGGSCSLPAYHLARRNLRGDFSLGPSRLGLNNPFCGGEQLLGWDSLAAPVVFLGFDVHATHWYEQRGEFWRDEGEAWGVEGALGFFGSATPAVFMLHVTARPSSP